MAEGLFERVKARASVTEVWVFGDIISEGMRREIAAANRYFIPVRYYDTNCGRIRTYD